MMHTNIPWWRRTRDAEGFAEAKRRLERPMMALAVVFTITLVVGEVAEMSDAARVGLAAVNAAIWAVFAVEYVWLLRLAPDRGRFVRTHWLDLLIVLMPLLRPLRVLRLVRLLPVAQLASVAAHAWRQIAAVMRHRGMGGLLVAVGALLGVAGAVAYAIEPETFAHLGDAIWWVVVTSMTVGYGDIAPVGMAARLVAVVVMIVGVGVVGVITANILDYWLPPSARRMQRTSGAPAVPTTPNGLNASSSSWYASSKAGAGEHENRYRSATVRASGHI